VTSLQKAVKAQLNEAEIFFGRQEAKKDLLRSINRSPPCCAGSGAGAARFCKLGCAQLIANGVSLSPATQ
jgi:hypothetical protein